MTVELKRTIQEWRNLDPVNIAQRQGRPVAKHALVDAKHDILALAARVEELEDRQHIEIAPLSLSASLVLPEREGAALTSDLSARINRVSRRSLDGTVIMSSEEWNGVVKKVEKLLTAPQPAPDVTGLVDLLRDIGDVCRQLEMPSERAIAEWADRIDAALAAHREQGGES